MEKSTISRNKYTVYRVMYRYHCLRPHVSQLVRCAFSKRTLSHCEGAYHAAGLVSGTIHVEYDSDKHCIPLLFRHVTVS